VQPVNESLDRENKWKSTMLIRDYTKYVLDNNLYTEDMEKAYKHLFKLNLVVWLSIPVKLKIKI
jgi:hypothetical protein